LGRQISPMFLDNPVQSGYQTQRNVVTKLMGLQRSDVINAE